MASAASVAEGWPHGPSPSAEPWRIGASGRSGGGAGPSGSAAFRSLGGEERRRARPLWAARAADGGGLGAAGGTDNGASAKPPRPRGSAPRERHSFSPSPSRCQGVIALPAWPPRPRRRPSATGSQYRGPVVRRAKSQPPPAAIAPRPRAQPVLLPGAAGLGGRGTRLVPAPQSAGARTRPMAVTTAAMALRRASGGRGAEPRPSPAPTPPGAWSRHASGRPAGRAQTAPASADAARGRGRGPRGAR